jgi:hypothetical protein
LIVVVIGGGISHHQHLVTKRKKKLTGRAEAQSMIGLGRMSSLGAKANI